MATTKLLNNSSTSTARMRSIYRMSDAQPDWAQDDPSQPDYIKNKEQAERFRPISVNGQEVLDDTYASGGVNLVGGNNVTIKTDGNSIIISAKASGGGGSGGDCDCPEYVEGAGIDIVENAYGQQEISIEYGAISDDMIQSVSIEKIVYADGATLILNGGNANGTN